MNPQDLFQSTFTKFTGSLIILLKIGKWHLGEDVQGFHLSTANGKGGPEGKFYGNVDVAEQMTDRAAKLRVELDAWQKKTKAPLPQVPNPERVLK